MKRNRLYLLVLLALCGNAVTATSPAAPPETPMSVAAQDSTPKQVMVKARIIQVEVTAAGVAKETMLESPIVSTLSDMPGKIGFASPPTETTFSAKPHVNTDGSINMEVAYYRSEKDMRYDEDGSLATVVKQTEYKTTRHFKAGKATRLGGLTDEQDDRVKKAISDRKPFPSIGRPYSVLYLDVTASVIADPLPNKNP